MQCPTPIFVKLSRAFVPCGKCGACRARKANEWIIRLNEEWKHANTCAFVTLTYNDEFIPLTDNNYKTLVKKDLQDFINLLRQYAPFRYFGIGEYGDKGDRPHYHILIFNFTPIVDPGTNQIVYYRDWSKITQQMLISNVDTEAIIFKAWKKGIITVEPLEGGAIRYLANYMVDLSVKPTENEQTKIFALMSKRPPIGYQYYNNPEVLKYHTKGTVKDKLAKFHYTSDMGKTALPRLYRDKLFSRYMKGKYAEKMQEDQTEKLRRVKDINIYAKNFHESNEHKNDMLNLRNPKRSL